MAKETKTTTKTTKTTAPIKVKKEVKAKKPVLKFQKIDAAAKPLLRKRPTDIGINISALKKTRIAGNTHQKISTGIRLEIPKGYWVKVFDRSGMAANTSLIVKAGVIDEDYRGEVIIIMANIGNGPQTIDAGQEIAQLVLVKAEYPELQEAEISTDTVRGEAGFGSSDSL